MSQISAQVTVIGTAAGAEVVRLEAPHGVDPGALLAAHGWHAERTEAGLLAASDVQAISADPWTLAVTLPVSAGDVVPLSDRSARHDPDLSAADLAEVVPYRRVAAYAVVESSRGVLLTELSSRTNAAGSWTLPGGGLDPGEGVRDGLAREVWEESGAAIAEVELLGVESRHWVGRAPNGRVEDYQAVRIVHRATCPDPTEPVIHDVGGSTSDARWVAWGDVERMDVVESFAAVLRWCAAAHRGTTD